ncbi:MAG: hypothetical protein JW809_05635, partial [Pirellulales bacterium]|nr:hypothetical protein [Pirellulales bacterium]
MKHSRWIVVALVGGLFAWMFAGLAADRALAVRDAAHFYYPLFEYIQDQWRAGRLPEWNPHENAGAPLAADPAASVFYPGKLVFFLPIDHARAMNLYVAGHLLLAAFGAYRLARHFHASVEAAGACAVSYAFSGSVLFQYTNVIYLVGAAWLPAALWAADHMLRRRGLAAALLLGVVLAMTTLGGDPQMAYHAGLLAALDALILWQCRRRLSRFTRRGLSRFS